MHAEASYIQESPFGGNKMCFGSVLLCLSGHKMDGLKVVNTSHSKLKKINKSHFNSKRSCLKCLESV